VEASQPMVPNHVGKKWAIFEATIIQSLPQTLQTRRQLLSSLLDEIDLSVYFFWIHGNLKSNIHQGCQMEYFHIKIPILMCSGGPCNGVMS
jgi:hypothetical protein